MHHGRRFLFLLMMSAVVGCSSKLVIRSEPSEAIVHFVVPDTNERKPIGVTPLEISSSQISDFTRYAPTQGAFLEFVVEKEGYQAQSMLVPYSRMFTRVTEVQIRLLVKEKLGKVYHNLVQHLVNAQSLIHRLELSRAEMEIQRALKIDADFVFTRLLLGNVYFLKGEYARSLREYERVLELEPNNQEALKLISRVRKLSPRTPAAKENGGDR